MHRFLNPIGYATLAILLATTACAAAKLPNIVIVYADDLGYGDLSCYNPKAAYQTPRLDRMAKEGVRFTDAHSLSTICSPSRYGLFSGQQICRSTSFLPVSEPLFRPSCAPTVKSNFLAIMAVESYTEYALDSLEVFKAGWAKNLYVWDLVGSDKPYHYLGSGRFFVRLGDAFASAMAGMMKQQATATP